MENFRVRTFRQLLLTPPHTSTSGGMGPGGGGAEEEQLAMLGELMFFSHQSYSECGLGSAGTDRWVTQSGEEGARECWDRQVEHTVHEEGALASGNLTWGRLADI